MAQFNDLINTSIAFTMILVVFLLVMVGIFTKTPDSFKNLVSYK